MTKGPAPIDVKTSVRGGPIRWLVGGGLLLIATITIGTTMMAGNFRERALEGSNQEHAPYEFLNALHWPPPQVASKRCKAIVETQCQNLVTSSKSPDAE